MGQVRGGLAVGARPWVSPLQELARLRAQVRRHRVAYLFMVPFVSVFFLLTLAPVLVATYLSFTYFNLLQPPTWIGWSNYRALLLDDDIFLIGVRNTLFFAFIYGPVSFMASFTLAWLINQLRRLRAFYTLAMYAPSIVSSIAISVIWLYFLAGDRYGLINYLLMRVGILEEPFLWLRDPRTTMPSIVVVALWMSLGNQFLVFLAGLQNVDPQLYEAAAIDGVRNRLQELWYVTIPVMKPQFLFASVNAVVASFSVFDIAVALAGLPSHLYAGHTIVTHLYDYAFIRFEMGYAAAIAVILFLLTFATGRLAFRLFSTGGAY